MPICHGIAASIHSRSKSAFYFLCPFFCSHQSSILFALLDISSVFCSCWSYLNRHASLSVCGERVVSVIVVVVSRLGSEVEETGYANSEMMVADGSPSLSVAVSVVESVFVQLTIKAAMMAAIVSSFIFHPLD